MVLEQLYNEVKARVEESINYHFSSDPLVVTSEEPVSDSGYDSAYDFQGHDLEQPEDWTEDVELDQSLLE